MLDARQASRGRRYATQINATTNNPKHIKFIWTELVHNLYKMKLHDSRRVARVDVVFIVGLMLNGVLHVRSLTRPRSRPYIACMIAIFH